jgi:hypothetical protein
MGMIVLKRKNYSHYLKHFRIFFVRCLAVFDQTSFSRLRGDVKSFPAHFHYLDSVSPRPQKLIRSWTLDVSLLTESRIEKVHWKGFLHLVSIGEACRMSLSDKCCEILSCWFLYQECCEVAAIRCLYKSLPGAMR